MQHRQLAGCVGAVDIVVDGAEEDSTGAAAGMNRRCLRTWNGETAAASARVVWSFIMVLISVYNEYYEDM
jgi:hypothetical protein